MDEKKKLESSHFLEIAKHTRLFLFVLLFIGLFSSILYWQMSSLGADLKEPWKLLSLIGLSSALCIWGIVVTLNGLTEFLSKAIFREHPIKKEDNGLLAWALISGAPLYSLMLLAICAVINNVIFHTLIAATRTQPVFWSDAVLLCDFALLPLYSRAILWMLKHWLR